MKAKITKGDGTVIEMEGTAAELASIIDPTLLPKVTLTPPANPACPGLGDKESIGKLIDVPYQPQYPLPDPWPSFVYNDMCPMGGAHDYPTVWMSVSPPACSKCGKGTGIAPSTTYICTQTISGELVENGTKYEFKSTLPEIPFISAFTIVPRAPQS